MATNTGQLGGVGAGLQGAGWGPGPDLAQEKGPAGGGPCYFAGPGAVPLTG